MVEHARILLGKVMLLVELGEALPMRGTRWHLPGLGWFLRCFRLRCPFSFFDSNVSGGHCLLLLLGLWLLPCMLHVPAQVLLALWIGELDRRPLLLVLAEAVVVLAGMQEAKGLSNAIRELGEEQELLVRCYKMLNEYGDVLVQLGARRWALPLVDPVGQQAPPFARLLGQWRWLTEAGAYSSIDLRLVFRFAEELRLR